MMDMEMNAELERDGGSEAGEASYEGSSAGSVYCSLEQDFARITREMKDNEDLAVYEAEYTRLFESLYKARHLEEQLTEQCKSLKEQVAEGSDKVQELNKKVEADAESIEQLKKEILDGKKFADTAHTREQKAQEVIENLRVSITKLTDELDLKTKQLSSEDTNTAMTKQKDSQAKERERLMGEVEALRQRLKTVTIYKQEAEDRLNETERKVSELQDKVDRLVNDIAKERREHEKTGTDLEFVREELNSQIIDLQTAEEALKTTESNYAKQEKILRSQVLENEKNEKEIRKLLLKQLSMKTDGDKLAVKYEEARKEIVENSKYIKDANKTAKGLNDEIGKLKLMADHLQMKLTREKSLKSKADESLSRVTLALRNAESEVESMKRQMEEERKAFEKLNREKDTQTKNLIYFEDMNKKLQLELRVFEQANRKLEGSLEDCKEQSDDLNRQIKSLEKDKDRCSSEVQDLLRQIDDYEEEVKLKRQEIVDYLKQIAEGDAVLRKQQSVFEDMRAERNSYKKNLSQCQELVGDLKNKGKELNTLLVQTKEQLQTREAELMKQEFLFNKLEKEKDSLANELEASEKKYADLRQELDEARQEQKRLRNLLVEADENAARQRKDIEAVMNERDVIGAQIVRRNDEMSLQYGKIKTLEKTLEQGEKQYTQRLEDIRMLQLEVNKLKFEKSVLDKSASYLIDVRSEVFHLERTLTKERLKVMALEEEVQSPLNVHRWRNLEGTDPDTYGLLRKIHILQKRILKMSSEMITKDKKIRETERLYMNLREFIAKQPGPEILVRLTKTRRALMDRGKKMKCLVAELNMTLKAEHQYELEKVKRELHTVKSKYYAQKKKEQQAIELGHENLPSVPKTTLKFHGGGFNLNPTSKRCITPHLTPINK